MAKPIDWRDRLLAAHGRTGKSMREVSLAAGLGPNYLREVVLVGKSATVECLIAICAVLDIGLGSLADDDILRRQREMKLAYPNGPAKRIP